MSNIAGHIYYKPTLTQKYSVDAQKNCIEFSNSILYVKGSGLTETFAFHIAEQNHWSWVVCGIGIAEMSRFITTTEWQRILTPDQINLDNVDGHWIILRWKENKVEFYNDHIELRKLYWKRENDRIVFATQLVDIADMLDKIEFSFKNYAGYYHYLHSYGDDSILKDINRLGQRGQLKIRDDKVSHKTAQWEFNAHKEQPFTIEKLRDIANIKIPNRKKAVLLLSGGIDSRTVLALQENTPDLITFGEHLHPDTIVAKNIADRLKKELQIHTFSLPETIDEQIQVFDKLKKTALYEYPGLIDSIDILENKNDEGYWALDGGCGEVIRHGYGRKLAYFGQKYRKKNDFATLSRLQRKKTYPCFEKKIDIYMAKWAEDEYVKAMTEMPKELNINDWIALAHIRYGLKNFPVNGQAFNDSKIPSYMPLVQPSIIRSIQTYPTKKRVNLRLNDKIIKTYMPSIKNIPCVRYNTIIPAALNKNPIIAKIYADTKNKIKHKKTNYKNLLMLSLKDIVIERINSAPVKDCGWYDTKKIIELTQAFYDGKYSDSQFLYNWLAVDFWREKC